MIVFDRESRVALASENVVTLIGTEVCQQDMEAVWDAVFEFIEEQIAEGHGVKIPGLATLSYKRFHRNVSNKFLTIEKHAYLQICEGLVDMYALQSKRPPSNLVTATELNMAWIAKKTHLKRSDVITCVEEVTHAFRTALVSDAHVEFDFDDIGKIVIRCNTVTSSLNREFMCRHGFGFRSYYDMACRACMPS